MACSEAHSCLAQGGGLEYRTTFLVLYGISLLSSTVEAMGLRRDWARERTRQRGNR